MTTSRNIIRKTLVLNAGYQPLVAVTWQDAMCLIFRDKCSVITYYDDWTIRSAHQEHKVPAVVRLHEYSHPAPERTKFNRENVFLRDDYSCQYCGRRGTYRTLTFDHVHPRSKGGKTTWTNVVTACRLCNSCKGDKVLHETNMRLQAQPIPPIRRTMLVMLFAQQGITPPEWIDWLV